MTRFRSRSLAALRTPEGWAVLYLWLWGVTTLLQLTLAPNATQAASPYRAVYQAFAVLFLAISATHGGAILVAAPRVAHLANLGGVAVCTLLAIFYCIGPNTIILGGTFGVLALQKLWVFTHAGPPRE